MPNHLLQLEKSYMSSQCRLPSLYVLKAPMCELVGFINADMPIAFQLWSALVS